MKFTTTSLVAAVVALLAGSACADQTAIAFDATKLWGLEGGVGVFGWQFTARSDIQVSALGIYDSAGFGYVGDGLLESHPIAIWDVSSLSSPLVSGTIPDNVNAPLVNGFRYVSTPPATLMAGHNYVIAALYPHVWDQTTGAINNPGFLLTVDPAIGFGGYQWSNAGVLSFPPNYVPSSQFAFGPNFTFTSIPEPSIFALFTLAAAVRPFRRRTCVSGGIASAILPLLAL